MFRIQPVRRMPVSYNTRSVWNEFDKMFDDFLSETPTTLKMKVDILDQDDKYLLEAELPGFSKENIDITLKDDYLTISVARNEDKEENNGKYLRRERSTASYKRTFYIENIKEEEIKASFDKGVLTLELPKEEVVVNEAKRIEVK